MKGSSRTVRQKSRAQKENWALNISPLYSLAFCTASACFRKSLWLKLLENSMRSEILWPFQYEYILGNAARRKSNANENDFLHFMLWTFSKSSPSKANFFAMSGDINSQASVCMVVVLVLSFCSFIFCWSCFVPGLLEWVYAKTRCQGSLPSWTAASGWALITVQVCKFSPRLVNLANGWQNICGKPENRKYLASCLNTIFLSLFRLPSRRRNVCGWKSAR